MSKRRELTALQIRAKRLRLRLRRLKAGLAYSWGFGDWGCLGFVRYLRGLKRMGCAAKVSALWGWFEALGDTSSIDEVMVFVLAGAGWAGGISRIWGAVEVWCFVP